VCTVIKSNPGADTREDDEGDAPPPASVVAAGQLTFLHIGDFAPTGAG